MRIVSFRRDGQVSYGMLDGDSVVDLPALDHRLPPVLRDALPVLGGGYVPPAGARQAVSLSEVTVLPVIPDPQKIICIGVNYADHAAETGQAPPPYPTVFAKFANTLIASGDPIVLPAASAMPDYEGELAVVIGRPGRRISEQDALSHVAGYTAFDDVSARDFQGHTSQWTMGKSPDTFAPMGLALVTADEVPDPQQLDLRTTVSGEVLQHASTADMIFTVRQLIAYLSQTMTLLPGDVIATGTPSGVGAARTPQRFLRPGDTVVVSIEGVTELANPVVAEDA
jgi:2-keto-4-pentenoate hydratase/2-oxohepta-3-ene-1,7-dioic acid hydratase in catechol pathway